MAILYVIEVKVLEERLREETLQPKNPFAHRRADFCSGLTGTRQSLCHAVGLARDDQANLQKEVFR
jgi:hypothetical protein